MKKSTAQSLLTEMLLQRAKNQKTQPLHPAQQKELDQAYEESFDEDQLVDHAEMKRQYRKWL
jgi:hypothetical protein